MGNHPNLDLYVKIVTEFNAGEGRHGCRESAKALRR
jgi:hypothetical protein